MNLLSRINNHANLGLLSATLVAGAVSAERLQEATFGNLSAKATSERKAQAAAGAGMTLFLGACSIALASIQRRRGDEAPDTSSEIPRGMPDLSSLE